MVKESEEILAHLDRVVLGLGHTEYPQLAVLPRPMLLQQERQQHEQSAVVHDPPDINVALDLVTRVGIPLDSLGYQQCHLGGRSVPDGVNKHAPGVLLPLPPAIGPAQNNRIWFHAPQTGTLNTVMDKI
jgi:hypothetical protein